MTSSSRLVATHVPDRPEGSVLVLHGGGSRGPDATVSRRQLSVLRMVPLARHLAHAEPSRLAVFRLLNSARGWSGPPTPVDDALRAVEEVGRRVGPDLPVGLVGHSLGGRAALLAGGAAPVTSVVALNPWVMADDSRADLAGRQVLVVHGGQDRVASPSRSLGVADRIGRRTRCSYVRVEEGGHAMVRHHRTFTGLATEFTRSVLLDAQVSDLVTALARGGGRIRL
ncbi:alpha/beta hydrolase [Aeromicrobium marinum]|uniref:alpha/beta hydrolase n=1 Tax=Aeromicrobium marinum TaxID=219314 RepID=UPI0001BCD406|nr:alpha/beta fold hydrolase [Aeromicrobium marinum]